MTATKTDQLLEIHNRANRVADDLRLLYEGAKLHGLPFVALGLCAKEVDTWRTDHMYRALGKALTEEDNRS